MTTYTDDEIREALLRTAELVSDCIGAQLESEKKADLTRLRWLASEYPRLKADAERFAWWFQFNVGTDPHEHAPTLDEFRAQIDASRAAIDAARNQP